MGSERRLGYAGMGKFALSLLMIGLLASQAQAQPVHAVVTETGAPPCRWFELKIGQSLWYGWGSNLQSLTSTWRTAFQRSISDWNATPTKAGFVAAGAGTPLPQVMLNTYSAQDGYSGKAIPTCSGSWTGYYSVLANMNYNPGTNSKRRALTGHELGHSLSLGHIQGTATIALLGYNPNSELYYSPQAADIELVNKVYP